MMIHQIIFIGGVHGVGKTHFSQHLAHQINIAYVSASTLIRQAGQSIVSGQKQVAAISENQDLLLTALRNYKSPTTSFLLDGHFCLLDKNSDIQPIQLNTFQQIAPRAVIVVVDEPSAIVERISTRDKMTHSQQLITEFQACEISYAQLVCRNLTIPLRIHNFSDSIDDALEFIKRNLV